MCKTKENRVKKIRFFYRDGKKKRIGQRKAGNFFRRKTLWKRKPCGKMEKTEENGDSGKISTTVAQIDTEKDFSMGDGARKNLSTVFQKIVFLLSNRFSTGVKRM